jgi:hypothetical protein
VTPGFLLAGRPQTRLDLRARRTCFGQLLLQSLNIPPGFFLLGRNVTKIGHGGFFFLLPALGLGERVSA